jgi:hypothetical protein
MMNNVDFWAASHLSLSNLPVSNLNEKSGSDDATV